MHAIVDHVPGSAFVPDTRSLQRVAAAIGVSLLLHALLLAVHRQPPAAAVAAPPTPLTVRLQAAAPPSPAPPVTVPEPRSVPRQAKAAAPAKRSRPVIAVPAASRQSAEETYSVAPPPAVPAQDDAPPSTAPHFDMAAARNTARKVANEPDPAKVGTALERLPPKPLETESKLARGIGAAKRGNCKDGIPGGLLAPIYLMLEKKDSGCKW